MELILSERIQNRKHGEWIGVDFDGTFVEYHGWTAWNVFGKPIPAMVNRVKFWLSNNIPVRIVTARVALSYGPKLDNLKRHTCPLTGEHYSTIDMVLAIQDCTANIIGARLPVQCYKDYQMIELWDDRAIQVVPNTGISLADEHEAVLSALRGKAFNPYNDPFVEKGG